MQRLSKLSAKASALSENFDEDKPKAKEKLICINPETRRDLFTILPDNPDLFTLRNNPK